MTEPQLNEQVQQLINQMALRSNTMTKNRALCVMIRRNTFYATEN